VPSKGKESLFVVCDLRFQICHCDAIVRIQARPKFLNVKSRMINRFSLFHRVEVEFLPDACAEVCRRDP
jgi:hypothetical protein